RSSAAPYVPVRSAPIRATSPRSRTRSRSTASPPPLAETPGRTFAASRPVRLSDVDVSGRLRLDAVARYLQDVAADDVLDAGWSPDEHIWVVRRTELDVRQPFVDDTRVELVTWCAGTAAAAAARRTTVRGDRGGRIEAEMIWIHLGRDLQPLRLGER